MRIIALALLMAVSFSGFSQESNYENLQVLPKDITKQQMSGIMKGWSKALGVRCHFCHVGEPGAPLSSYDFASDDKKYKKIARQMVEMTRMINGDHLNKIHEGSRIDCRTCHRGLAHPRSLGQVLDINLRRKGLDGAVKRYGQLREKYFGADTFDFTESSLNNYADSLARRGKVDEAVRFLNLNLDHFPKSANAHFMLGDILADKGDKEAATKHLKKALELDPKMKDAKKRLESF